MQELSLHILDIVRNSIRANASLIQTDIEELPGKDQYVIRISDNGTGMSYEELKKVTNPFFTSRTRRKVGLGIPLLKQNAEQTGGFVEIQSTEGKGTTIRAVFGFSHIDRPVLGDIAGTLLILCSNEKSAELVYRHKTAVGEFCFDSREIKSTLEGVSVNNAEVRSFLLEMIRENLKQIQASE